MRVLVSDSLSEKGLAILRAEEGIEVTVNTKLSPEQLVAEIGGYDALIVRSATTVTSDVIAAGKRLKVIGRAGVGVDNIDVEAATARGIIVVNAPEGNSISTAEHTIAMMMAMARMIPQAYMSIKQGKWDRKTFMGVEVHEKTIGVVGLGRIGREVAKRALGLGMEVLGYDPFITEDMAKSLGIALADLDDLCRRADFITVHTPLNEHTRGLIDSQRISMMKDGVRIINCARGGIVDERALYEGLTSGKVKAAALDVFVEEPPFGNPLIGLDNVIFTPHLGASTTEAQENVAVDVAKQVIRILQDRPFKNAVNLPSVRPEVYEFIRPYMDLATRLGAFMSAVCRGGVEAIEVEYTGDLAETEVAPITNYLVKGVLAPVLDVPVTIVNAPLLARSRGIRISEIKSQNHRDFPSLVKVKVVSKSGCRSISGTVYGSRDPRIIELDGYRVDFAPDGNVLLIPHRDKPGVIGEVGRLLGKAGVNIASMYVGRKQAGGEAVMLLGVDGRPSSAAMDSVKAADGVLGVYHISL